MSNLIMLAITPVVVLTISSLTGNTTQLNTLVIIIKTLSQQLMSLINTSYLSGANVTTVSIFIIIMLINMQSLYQYIFAWTAHIIMTLSLSLSTWTGILMLGWINNSTNNLMHLTPIDTPSYLISFMSVIEAVSILIRPITLSVRLAANITAGHLLLSLIAWPNTQTTLIVTSQMFMVTLEVLVAVIQAFVFTILFSLYLSEGV